LLFKIDDTVTWLSFPEFWRNSLNQNKALSLQPIRLTRMFAVHGDAATPAEAVQQVNDALGLIQSDAIGSKLELIDPPIMPGRAIRPKSPLALVVGIAGFLFLGLPGIWLIRRGVFVLLVILIPVAVLGGLVLVSYLSLQQPAPPVPVGIDR
jgi:hypothetical protein